MVLKTTPGEIKNKKRDKKKRKKEKKKEEEEKKKTNRNVGGIDRLVKW